MSWRKFLTVDDPKRDSCLNLSRFLVDEEKKVALCYKKRMFEGDTLNKDLVYIAGEDNEIKRIDFGAVTCGSLILDYLPSLTYI